MQITSNRTRSLWKGMQSGQLRFRAIAPIRTRVVCYSQENRPPPATPNCTHKINSLVNRLLVRESASLFKERS